MKGPWGEFASGCQPSAFGCGPTADGSVDVPIYLPHQALVVGGRVEVVDNGRIIRRDAVDPVLVSVEHCPGAVPRRIAARVELCEEHVVPDDRMTAPLAERGHDGGGAGAAIGLDQPLDGGDADVREVH